MVTKKKKLQKQQILSLVGTLHHTTKVVRPGKAFVTAMYSIAARLPKVHFITRLNVLFRLDLLWWHAFLQALNVSASSDIPLYHTYNLGQYRHFWSTELCGSTDPPLVTVAMASGMAEYG